MKGRRRTGGQKENNEVRSRERSRDKDRNRGKQK